MKLIVFGATGGTGRALIDQGLAAGHDVTAFSRSAFETPARQIRGDIFDCAQVTEAVRGHDAVLSCLGTRPWRHQDVCSGGIASIVPAMNETGVRRVIVVSSQGVGDSKLGLFGKLGKPLLRRSFADKLAMEQQLAASDVEWIVVRPALLTNGALRGTCRAADDNSLTGGSIGRADVAAFTLAQLTSDRWLRKMPVIVA